MMTVSILLSTRRYRGAACAALFAAVLALGACTYRAGERTDPIGRSFTWFSYLNADDLRAYCRSGTTDRYRLVYNGVWQEQVRTYDITVTGPGRAELVIQVRGEPDLSQPIPLDDLLKPWRGVDRRLEIDAGALRRIRAGLRESDFYVPPPDGLRIHSWGFFWVVAACENGRFRFNAWEYPSERFAKVVLKDALATVDTTGVPFNPPRATFEPSRQGEERQIDRYTLIVRGDGFASDINLF